MNRIREPSTNSNVGHPSAASSPFARLVVAPKTLAFSPGSNDIGAPDLTALDRGASTQTRIYIREEQPSPVCDIVAEQKVALYRNGSQRQKHVTIRGSAARTVRSRGRDIYTTDIPLTRLGNQVASGEGLLEGDAWTLLDFLYDDISDFVAQPFSVEIEVFGERHIWWPDALLRRAGRPCLIEVKPLEEVHPEEPQLAAFVSARFSAIEAACTNRGAEFMLLTEREIRLQPRHQNSQVMFRAITAHIPERVVWNAADILVELPRITSVLALFERLPDHGDSALLIACMLDRLGYVELDRTEPFCPTSVFTNSLGRQR